MKLASRKIARIIAIATIAVIGVMAVVGAVFVSSAFYPVIPGTHAWQKISIIVATWGFMLTPMIALFFRPFKRNSNNDFEEWFKGINRQ